jgi:hypothetical protein
MLSSAQPIVVGGLDNHTHMVQHRLVATGSEHARQQCRGAGSVFAIGRQRLQEHPLLALGVTDRYLSPEVTVMGIPQPYV